MTENLPPANGNSIKARARLTTGIPGLDTLLQGGLVKGGVYLILGPPGSGKTILGNQVCFHHAKELATNVVYVTLLAESHTRMLENISSFEYYSDDMIGPSITYVSGYSALEKEGLNGLLSQIAGVVRAKKATLLVVDGVTTIGDMDHSPLGFRKFAHELNSVISSSGATALLLSSMEGHHSEPEHTMVDGIIALHHESLELRAVRQIEVRKFRGSNHLQGKHHFSINDLGLHVIPRSESMKPSPRKKRPPEAGRASLKIPGLDEMLGGGVLRNSITTLIGAAGTGKTILGLHFLQAGAAIGEQGLFFGFYETPEDLIEKAESLNLRFQEMVDQRKIKILWHPALEQELDELGESLIEEVRRANVQRIVIDGVDGFRYSTINPKRINRFLVALVLRLKAEGVTVLLIEETSLFSDHHHRQVAELSALNESILFLRHLDLGCKMMRVISIMKVRSAIYDPSIRELHIDRSGVQVLGAVPPQSTYGPSAPGSPAQSQNDRRPRGLIASLRRLFRG